MIYIAFCLFTILASSFCNASTETQQLTLEILLDLESAQVDFVKGVNAITGDFIDVQVDMTVFGNQKMRMNATKK